MNSLDAGELATDSVNIDAIVAAATDTVAIVRGYSVGGLTTKGKVLGYLAPSTGHWFLRVRDFAYHLVFVVDANRKRTGIRFAVHAIDEIIPNDENGQEGVSIGVTPFSENTILMIGRALITQFGDYHRLFWNCQDFMMMFAKLICPDVVNANRLRDAADVSRTVRSRILNKTEQDNNINGKYLDLFR